MVDNCCETKPIRRKHLVVTPNILSILIWCYFVLSESVPVFLVSAVLFLLWTLLNEYVWLVEGSRLLYAATKGGNYIIIPFAIMFLFVRNGILHIEGADPLSFPSCYPLAIHMVFIIFLYELIDYFRKRVTSRRALRRTILIGCWTVLTFSNLLLCISWFGIWIDYVRPLPG